MQIAYLNKSRFASKEMNKNLLWVISAIIIAGGVWYFFQSGYAPSQENENVQEDSTNDEIMDESSTEQNENMDDTDEVMQDEEMNDGMTETAIIYTDSGYSPSDIKVSAGTSVVFKNESSGGMWVASNPHPVHTDFSAFDNKTSVSVGGTYSFTFVEGGTYEYHNHVNPAHGGTITVE